MRLDIRYSLGKLRYVAHRGEARGRSLQRLHLCQRQKECKGRFRALVEIDPVEMQTVVASARGWIVQWLVEVVPAQEPLECPLGLVTPERIQRRLECFNAGRHGGLRFDGLLVETGPRTPAAIKPVRADRHESDRRGSAPPPANAAFAGPTPAPSSACVPPWRPLLISACGSLALS